MLLDRLQHCLADTHARDPRPVAAWELPLGMDRLFLKGRWLKRLTPAAVLVGIRQQHNPSVILTLRSASLRAHGGQVSFPGGRAEPEENFPIGTALREAHEEIGLEPEASRVIGYLDDYPTVSRFRVTPVVALIDQHADIHSESEEVESVFEVPLAFVLDPDSYERKKLGRLGLSYYELHYKRFRIWGATAGMLYNLQQRFEQHEMG